MKKLSIFVVAACLLLSGVLFAQDTKATTPTPPADYMMIGGAFSLNYFVAGDSAPSGLIFFKTAIKSNHGVQLDLGTFNVPITEYDANYTKYTGYGEESFLNVGINYLYFIPSFRYVQLKLGVDYYQYLNGYIANTEGILPADPNCGTLYTLCHNCVGNMFGVNLGVNLDVPIYESIYAVSSLSYKYLITHDEHKKGVIDARIGLAYKIK